MKKRTGKIFALLLSLTMVTGMLAGCGAEKPNITMPLRRQRQPRKEKRRLSLVIPHLMRKMRNPISIPTVLTADGHVSVMASERH